MFTKRARISATIAAGLLAVSLAACEIDGDFDNGGELLGAEQLAD